MSGARQPDPAATVAVIGMACRLPGAANPAELWRNLRAGVESVLPLDDADLAAAGVPRALWQDPGFVRAGTEVDGYDCFDAGFFSLRRREAERLDPQQRLFLEAAWAALEDAGHLPEHGAGRIAVFASAATSDPSRCAGQLAGRVSFLLDLQGPSVGVQCACSSSLLAVHLACESLLGFGCDLALAGGVSIRLPQKAGYRYEAGGVVSPDGRCRAFDAAAAGTVFGSGLGVVVLRRLADALADRDPVRALILGSAANNDGAGRIGFSAPGEHGQAEVIAHAQAMAGVEPDSISYIEAHGTGTPLGDAIEVAALTRAFRGRTAARGFCAMGSIKPNVGHLETASGVAGLLKTVLALENREIPPCLHYRTANPAIDFAATPFFVASRLAPWAGAAPRRAGVSSFGIGGTNVHLVLQEAPPMAPASSPAPPARAQALVVSARSAAALRGRIADLAGHLGAHPELELADVAFTLQTGRRAMGHRAALVCRDRGEAATALAGRGGRLLRGRAAAAAEVVFFFPGQGRLPVGMALDLYRHEPRFRVHLERCAELLLPTLGLDFLSLLYADGAAAAAAARELAGTALAQPVIFALGHSLACWWLDLGVRPAAMIGDSLGEYVAAALAGVFSLAEGLGLAAARGRLLAALPAGAMLAVGLPAAEAEALLAGTELALAATRAVDRCTISGPAPAIEALERRLGGLGVPCLRLPVARAFHSPMMAAAAPALAAELARLDLRPPRIPYVSNVTGTWIASRQAADPAYWARQLLAPVRLCEGLATALNGNRLLLTLGVAQSLGRPAAAVGRRAPLPRLASLAEPRGRQPDREVLLASAAALWAAGVEIDWRVLGAGEPRRRVSLPTYPFARRRYPVVPPERSQASHAISAAWQPAPRPLQAAGPRGTGTWLLVCDPFDLDDGLSERLPARLRRHLLGEGRRVVTVVPSGAAAASPAGAPHEGSSFAAQGPWRYAVDPRRADDVSALLRELRRRGAEPERLVHLWLCDESAGARSGRQLAARSVELLATAAAGLDPPFLGAGAVVTRGARAIAGEPLPARARGTAAGAWRRLAAALRLGWRMVDLDPGPPASPGAAAGETELLIAELAAGGERMVAHRAGARWVPAAAADGAWRDQPEPATRLAPEEGRRSRRTSKSGGSAASMAAPLGELERALGALWQDVLGVARVGAADNFLQLGGDSILGLQVVRRALARGIEVNPGQLLAAATLGQLAAEVAAARSAGSPPPALAPRTVPASAATLIDEPEAFAKLLRKRSAGR